MARLHTLRDLQLRNWIRSGKAIARSDGGGLTFTLSTSGHASFVLRYRHDGKQREMTIGRYPDVTLERAREMAAELRREVASGVDVAREKQRKKQTRARPATFGDLAEAYYALGITSKGKPMRESSKAELRRYLDKDILPRLERLTLSELAPADVIALTKSIAERSHSVARAAYEFVSVICSHGVANSLLATHPCAHLKIASIIGTREKRERLKLDKDELAAFLAALPSLGRTNELAFKIILVTCVRKSELIKARWSNIDLDACLWDIPAEDAKNDNLLTIPLPLIVVDWFRELKALAATSPWALPARVSRRAASSEHISKSTLNAALKRIGWLRREPTPHDLRSTARSYLAELGVAETVAERCLNHAIGGLPGIYNKHAYLDERRHALELWAAFIDTLQRGEAWNVTPIKVASGA